MGEIWEIRELYDAETFSGASGTVTKDLPVTGQLSALILEGYWANQAGGDNTLNILELITKLEVVHRGSQVIKSLKGLQAAGIAWRRGKEYPFLWKMGNASSTQESRVVIPFGRYVGDTEFGLGLGALDNPKLKLEWNAAYALSGDTSGAFSATAGNWSLRGIFAPDGVSYSKYIKTSEIEQKTLTANTKPKYDLPVGYPWPRLYLYHDCADFSLQYNVEEIVLNVNSGEWKPIVLEVKELVYDDFSLFGSPRICTYFVSLNDTTLDIRSLFDCPWRSEVETQGGTATCHNLAQGIYDPTIDLIASAATIESKLIEDGQGFGRVYAVPFDRVSIAHAFQSGRYGKVELEVDVASAVGTTPQLTVILEEVMP